MANATDAFKYRQWFYLQVTKVILMKVEFASIVEKYTPSYEFYYCYEALSLTTEILLARQPIYDKKHRLYGFELLYRGLKDLTTQNKADQITATSELLANMCTNALEDNLHLGLPMFVNIDEAFIESESFFPGPSDNLVLEVLEHVPSTPNVLACINKLKRQGFVFALDDYGFEPCRNAFLPLMSIIKVDLSLMSLSELSARLPTLRKFKCQLLAEKVEDHATMIACLEMGFDLFQGYYLEYPSTVSGTKIAASKQVAIRIVAELSREGVTPQEVVSLLALDPRLTYKILLLVNSPLYQFVREISSVKDAVIALGLDAVKRWAMILTLVLNSEQPIELFRILLVRAKTLELYSEATTESDPSSMFMLGLLSGIDAVLEIDMETLLNKLSLSADLKSALLFKQNKMGETLLKMIGVERFDPQVLELLTTQEAYQFNQCYRGALPWADGVINAL